MKIGIIIDNIYGLHIMKYLSKFDHQYHIYIDNKCWYYGDNKRNDNIDNIKTWINYLSTLWVDKIILPPIYELAFLLDPHYQNFAQNANSSYEIANIYTDYISYCAKYSVVGKLGFIWDLSDFEFLDIYISQILSDFNPSANQSNNKYFMKPFLIYKKETNLRKYLLQNLSPNSHIINHTVKTDLRKISSYNIDTILPLNYAYFANTKSIKHHINKIKFHDINFDFLDQKNDIYSISIYISGRSEILLSQKKRKWLLCRGKSIERNVKLM